MAELLLELYSEEIPPQLQIAARSQIKQFIENSLKEDNRDVNLAACVELIHSATLLHDDVIDESSLRRGVKTTNSIWGNQSSILVGDYLLSRCFEIMFQDRHIGLAGEFYQMK